MPVLESNKDSSSSLSFIVVLDPLQCIGNVGEKGNSPRVAAVVKGNRVNDFQPNKVDDIGL